MVSRCVQFCIPVWVATTANRIFFTDFIVSGKWRQQEQDLTEEKEHWASRKKPQSNKPTILKSVRRCNVLGAKNYTRST